MKTDYFYLAFKKYKAWCKQHGYNHKEMSHKFSEFAGEALRELLNESRS